MVIPSLLHSRHRSLPLRFLQQLQQLLLLLLAVMAITNLSPFTSAFVLLPSTNTRTQQQPHDPRAVASASPRPGWSQPHGTHRTTTTTTSLDMALADFELTTPTADVMDLQEGQRLVCVGDVHGDVQALRNMLHVAGLVDRNENKNNNNNKEEEEKDKKVGMMTWTGGDTILVQTGDILDRGDNELACWRLLAGLSEQATQAGGAVIILWGNHEAMNCMGQFHYTTGEFEYRKLVESLMGNEYDEEDEDGSVQCNPNKTPPRHQPARESAYEPGTGLLVHPLLGKLKVAVKVGRTLCVHAGLTSKHLDTGGLAGLNRQAREWVQDGGNLPECLVGADGPLWMRDYSHPGNIEPTSDVASQRLGAALFCAGADRMVVGHTVQTNGINSALGGKVWRIDTGASRGVASGATECLEIVKEQGREVVSVLTADGGKLPGAERQAISPVLVERVVQAVADNLSVPLVEAVIGK
eukprot:scaffold6164_cov163-Amphora_coffeaeformis.AAC.20